MEIIFWYAVVILAIIIFLFIVKFDKINKIIAYLINGILALVILFSGFKIYTLMFVAMYEWLI